LIGSFKQQAFEERVEKDYRGEDKDGEEGNDEDLESSDDDSDKEELTNKAVDRLKKKTRAERNAKLVRTANRLADEERVTEKKAEKAYRQYDALMKQDARETKRLTELEEKRNAEEKEELRLQKEEGIITKPANVGRFKYQMKKTDFQLEEDLAGSLRTLRAQG